jgi:hypothetical protein
MVLVGAPLPAPPTAGVYGIGIEIPHAQSVLLAHMVAQLPLLAAANRCTLISATPTVDSVASVTRLNVHWNGTHADSTLFHTAVCNEARCCAIPS